MEFNEKLQELRKRRNLTQEQLASDLFVSRTAISKWESGRGYPSIESLRSLSEYFAVSLDELLSSEETVIAAEADSRLKKQHITRVLFGLLDCAMSLLLFLPLYGQENNGTFVSVPLFQLTGYGWYLFVPYCVCLFALVFFGVTALALQNCNAPLWDRCSNKISLSLSTVTVILFIASLQPYAAIFTFLFLLFKALMLIKWS